MDELKTTDNVESQLTPQQYFERILLAAYFAFDCLPVSNML